MIKQLTIFAENTRGAMHAITEVISGAGVDIDAVVTNDSAEYGIVRSILSDPEKAYDALTAKGYICKLNTVVAVEIHDEIGGLNSLLADIDAMNVNVNYLYVTYDRARTVPIVIINTNSGLELEMALRTKGYEVKNAPQK